MCGICGIAYSKKRPVEPERLLRMRETLSHRGPDGAGLWCHENVGLGHRRLSIIDLAGGKQPLSNEDGTIWVTFNGEIYNYRELAQDLVRRGHRFRTRSDTEVLVHAYEEYGFELVHRLNGMFAFAIYDASRRRLLLARDQVGVKPLFYSVTDEGLFFASEIKAIVAGTRVRPAARRESIQEYLLFRYVTGSNTFFEGVRRLPPGHVAVWEEDSLKVIRYWHPPAPEPEDAALSLDEATDALHRELSGAVERQLMSDVPLGTFCSGGLDSGLVTGYAARHCESRLHTFSVGFEDPAWDETPLARANAETFGTVHHALRLEPGDMRALLPRLIWYHDEPLSHPNSVPLYQLSRLAREHVKVVLTGEGSDELFAGYPRYQLARLTHGARAIAEPIRRLASAMARALPDHRAQRAAALLPMEYHDSLLFNSAFVDPKLVRELMGGDSERALHPRRELLQSALVGQDPVASLSRLEMQTYLSCLLDRMDRMSMAAGLEGRVPFLDLSLIEWGTRLPSRLKMTSTRNKRVVQELARRTLAPAVARGRKSGFGLPLATWFRRGPLSDVLHTLRDPAHPAGIWFDHGVVERLVAEHTSERFDHSEMLWLLVNVYVWHEVHATSQTASEDERFHDGASLKRGAAGSDTTMDKLVLTPP